MNTSQNLANIRRGCKNDGVLYQNQNITIIYEQSYGPTEYDIKHYLENMIKLVRNSVDDLNQHFVQYGNLSVMTAKKFKAISIQGYNLVMAKTYRMYEIFKCKLPISYTERWLLVRIAKICLCLETLLIKRQSVKEKMCEEDAITKSGPSCVSN
ncbi:21231_t:CDS:2 [Cetraspora pellucida]|uniref:21231_t:CDS:1 n=1 Tax=Cetraspora pellucida TaxID=1433469 RepID=A0A9N8ZCF1_9GLOM|nr:21231_t:CDS:2 [Cetraspora pellucida]